MKGLKFLLLIVVAASTLFFANCGGSEGPTEKETKTNLLVNNSPWVVSSVVVPPTTATEAAEWSAFTVSFTNTQMNTNNHPVGATAVWPSGAWSFTDNLSGIVRAADGVTMAVNTLNETTLSVTFTITGEELGGARVASLDGEYTFVMQKQ